MSYKLKTPQMMFDERQRAIKEAIDKKDLNIRLSWAINNATQVLASSGHEPSMEQVEEWAVKYLDLFEEMKQAMEEAQTKETERRAKAKDVGAETGEDDTIN